MADEMTEEMREPSKGLNQYQEFIASGMSPEEASAAITRSQAKAEKEKRLYRAARGALWSVIALLYLVIGFVFGWWHPGWLLFPFGVCLQSVLGIALPGAKSRRGRVAAAIVSGQLCLFLMIGLFTGRWILACLVICFSLAAWEILRFVMLWKGDPKNGSQKTE